MRGATSPIPATESAPRRISILGSTGSIGCNTVDLIRQNQESYQIVALTAQDNVARLIEQSLALRPEIAVIGNSDLYATLRDALAGSGIETAAGPAAILDAASRPADWIMAAIVGVAGLAPTMQAIRQGTTLAFANKECLVCAGDLMLEACVQAGTSLLPVDSEHNAIFQLFDFNQPESISHITLTASGGPFRTMPLEQLALVTPEQAVRHPNWDMGAKISVDSATMMNKALEMVEAFHLFPLAPEQIEVVLHPQSIIHSFVHYRDGSVLAQLGMPDMRVPIAYTLAYPQRMEVKTPRLSLTEMGALEFFAPDLGRFPAIALARHALAGAASRAITLNASNEIAVQAFLAGSIPFPRIVATVGEMLEQDENKAITSIEDAIYYDEMIRKITRERLSRL